MIEFKEITEDEAKPVILRWHFAGMPGNIVHSFGGLVDGQIILAGCFNRFANRQDLPILEFATSARDPSINIQMSQFLAYCRKQLRELGFHLLLTFVDRDHGSGSTYRGDQWKWDGWRDSSGTPFRLEGPRNDKGFYGVYWAALTQTGLEYAKLAELTEKPYK